MVLEPPMLAAVDLHQFADALAPRPRLVDAFALLAIAPQPVSDHPLAQGLAGDRKAVLGGELFGGQGRAEIGIVLAHDPQHRRADRLSRLTVARPAALLRNQTRDTVTAKRLQQPPYLALAAPQQLRGSTHRQTNSIDVAQHLETPQLAIAHAQHRHRCRPPQPAKKPGRLTSSNWTALTFAGCAYSHWRRYSRHVWLAAALIRNTSGCNMLSGGYANRAGVLSIKRRAVSRAVSASRAMICGTDRLRRNR
jgi:hypothetical protein